MGHESDGKMGIVTLENNSGSPQETLLGVWRQNMSLTGRSESFKSSRIVRAVCLPNQEGCLAVQGDESSGE